MSDVPTHLKYSKSHEWVELQEDGSVRVGITDHAQSLLGDMVYIEPPELGRELEAAEECAVVESVKAASDLYAPVAGEVSAVNPELEENPAMVNSSPFGDGWIFALTPHSAASLDELMDAAAYSELVAAESH